MLNMKSREKTCPEETLFYIGDRKQPIDRKTFKAIIDEQIAWEAKTFPQVATLKTLFFCRFG